MTNTGVCNCSARSKASLAMVKHSATLQGISMGWRVSPCESLATNSMSPCEVRVGNPVDGPTRWMSQMTPGIST